VDEGLRELTCAQFNLGVSDYSLLFMNIASNITTTKNDHRNIQQQRTDLIFPLVVRIVN